CGVWLILSLVTWQNRCWAQSPAPQVPSLEELAGDWQDASSLRSFPALNSADGSCQATRDLLSVENLSFPPITMSGQTGALFVDGKVPSLVQIRWYPYQVMRKGTTGSLGIETAVRMPYEKRGLLF